MLDLEGIIPAAVTPMNENAEVDEKQLIAYVDWLLSHKGLKGIAVNMDTGEGPHLTDGERARIIRIYKQQIKNAMPILAGICGRSTQEAEEQASLARVAGADAIVVFPPPVFAGAALSPKIPVAYHKAVARASGLPIILFQLQQALAGAIFQEETLLSLLEINEVAALKEASFDAEIFVKTSEIMRKSGRDVVLLTGNDNFIYESFLLGAKGALIGFGTIAIDEQIEMHKAAVEGRPKEGFAIWERIKPLEEAIFATPVRDYRARMKAALVMLGVISSAVMRPPLFEADSADKEKIRLILKRLGML